MIHLNVADISLALLGRRFVASTTFAFKLVFFTRWVILQWHIILHIHGWSSILSRSSTFIAITWFFTRHSGETWQVSPFGQRSETEQQLLLWLMNHHIRLRCWFGIEINYSQTSIFIIEGPRAYRRCELAYHCWLVTTDQAHDAARCKRARSSVLYSVRP